MRLQTEQDVKEGITAIPGGSGCLCQDGLDANFPGVRQTSQV
jgi:hypothetical protein